MTKRDRFYIEEKNRDLLNQKIKQENFLNMDNVKNKELFIFAAAMGIAAPIALDKKKTGLLLDKDLDLFDEAMVYSIAVSNLQNLNDIADKNIVYDFVEKCANQGFNMISNIIDTSSLENQDKQLLLELDEKYSSSVNN